MTGPQLQNTLTDTASVLRPRPRPVELARAWFSWRLTSIVLLVLFVLKHSVQPTEDYPPDVSATMAPVAGPLDTGAGVQPTAWEQPVFAFADKVGVLDSSLDSLDDATQRLESQLPVSIVKGILALGPSAEDQARLVHIYLKQTGKTDADISSNWESYSKLWHYHCHQIELQLRQQQPSLAPLRPSRTWQGLTALVVTLLVVGVALAWRNVVLLRTFISTQLDKYDHNIGTMDVDINAIYGELESFKTNASRTLHMHESSITTHSTQLDKIHTFVEQLWAEVYRVSAYPGRYSSQSRDREFWPDHKHQPANYDSRWGSREKPDMSLRQPHRPTHRPHSTAQPAGTESPTRPTTKFNPTAHRFVPSSQDDGGLNALKERPADENSNSRHKDVANRPALNHESQTWATVVRRGSVVSNSQSTPKRPATTRHHEVATTKFVKPSTAPESRVCTKDDSKTDENACKPASSKPEKNTVANKPVSKPSLTASSTHINQISANPQPADPQSANPQSTNDSQDNVFDIIESTDFDCLVERLQATKESKFRRVFIPAYGWIATKRLKDALEATTKGRSVLARCTV